MDVFSQYAYNDSFFENGTWSFNETEQEQRLPYNYYAMLLTLLIFVIVFGNVLVCMAVSREKALQTTTNYLIVSLAVADLLVATLVMPWVVYLEVVGEWRFSKIHCDIFVTLDVMMCTASILNLCAISIDRYTAVAMPMLYNTRYSSKRRVTVMISVVWVLSFAISCPLLFGLNNTATRDATLCVIANPAFVVYSSIVSFYVPFIITLLVYVQIYVVLRKRRKRVNTKPKQRVCQAVDTDVATSLKDKCTHPEDVRLCTMIVKSNGSLPVNKKKVIFIKDVATEGEDLELDELNNSGNSQKQRQQTQSVLGDTPATSHQQLMPDKANASPSSTPPTPPEESHKAEKNGEPKEALSEPAPIVAKSFQTQALPNGKTQTSVKSMSKRKISQQKEKKATQMLAIVLGVFIICWLPFFITHILNTHCTKCKVPAEMYNAFTWLGYVNSAVNPIIYTTFNIEFRKAFIKILHC
ncbi:dopamine receptor D2a [Kryptolebias marmoratus]|uniref:Dopamine receptor D2a n=1 Tax=Kryptolebias marmoratus TaxID=37003 RepID=A0A3Q3AN36_KRYMA|nr:dopamine receptor D2a [Kryptolebias marmoratus]XP_024864523.1 dopamine receptor D2a [Kryptolebias marmoratus]